MKMKKIGLGILSLFLMFVVVGCSSNKTAIDTSKFSSIAEEHQFTINDFADQYSEYEYVKEAIVASHEDGYQVEFYVLDNEANATSMFSNNKSTFESYKNGSATESSMEVGNYQTYSITTQGYYMYLCRVENTLYYVRVPETYQDTVKELTKDLGY